MGLVALAVGWLVGTAVRAGSGARGGLRFQLLAFALTYAAVALAYVPAMFAAALAPEIELAEEGTLPDEVLGDFEAPSTANARTEPPAPELAGVTDAAEVSPPGDPALAALSNDPVEQHPASLADDDTMPSALSAASAEPGLLDLLRDDEQVPDAVFEKLPIPTLLFLLSVLLLAAPVLIGFEAPITLLIAGFALWEAWRLNRRVDLTITGPAPPGSGRGRAGGG